MNAIDVPTLDVLGGAVGWALLTFLWQGTAVALLLRAALAVLPRAAAGARYLAGCLALATMLVLPAATALRAAGRGPELVPAERIGRTAFLAPEGPAAAARRAAAPRSAQPSPLPPARWIDALRRAVAPRLPLLAALWAVGVGLLTLRLAGGWVAVRRLVHCAVGPPPERWAEAAVRLAARLGVRRPVRLLRSLRVEVPTLVGWLRPAILLPAAALTGLDAQQLEAVLAHELAHVRRHDVLVNLMQSAVETLLFYHPAVWWVSARVREEREACCDDLAVAACGDRLLYARALAHLETLRGSTPAGALAATGGSLMHRIRRLVTPLDPPSDRAFPWPLIGVVAAVVLTLAVAGGGAPRAEAVPAGGEPEGSNTLSVVDPGSGGRTVIQRIGRDGDRRIVEVELEGGLFLRLRLDGDLQLAADGSSVVTLDPGGELLLETHGRGADRRLEMRAGADGERRYRWLVDGQERPFDDAGRAWMDAALGVAAARLEISELRGERSSLRGEISSLRGQRSSLRGQISSLRGERSSLRGRISSIHGQRSSLLGQISSIRGEISSERGKISSLRGQISSLEAQRPRLGDVDGPHADELRQKAAEMNRLIDRKVEAIEAQIDEVERRLASSDSEARIAAVRQEIDGLDVGGRVAEIEKEIEELDVEGRVAAIEKQIDELDVDHRVEEIEHRIDALDVDRQVEGIERRGLAPHLDALLRLTEQ